MDFRVKKISDNVKNNEFFFKKKYGQNFIVDNNIIDQIIKKSEIEKDSLIIEIGPGMGILTNKLADSGNHVLCYEIDETLKPFLTENLKKHQNIKIKYEDFLKSNVFLDIKEYKYKKLYVIANLPYYITTPILVKLIEDNINPDKIVIMVQKEVGDRFKASPGKKEYGSLSVYLNYYFEVKKLLNVSSNVFYPKPNVDSIVIEFTKKKVTKLKNNDLFFRLVKDSFKQKRKTIKNNLKNYDLSKIDKILSQYNYDLSVRAEQLSVEIFIKIANYLGEKDD